MACGSYRYISHSLQQRTKAYLTPRGAKTTWTDFVETWHGWLSATTLHRVDAELNNVLFYLFIYLFITSDGSQTFNYTNSSIPNYKDIWKKTT